ncbi:MAG: hypothetical protein R2879_22545 [Saprospiraceae bacterium]
MYGIKAGVLWVFLSVFVVKGYSQRTSIDPNQHCQDPIFLTGAIIEPARSAICLGCSAVDGANVVDGDLTNYATLSVGIGLLGGGTAISVRDTFKHYPAGNEAGFVIQPEGGLLTATVLSGFQLRTYRYGQLQETANYGALLKANVLNCGGGKYRVSFITSQPFDEIQLFVGGTVTLLSSIRVFYAFEGPGVCQEQCIDAIGPSLGATVSSGTESVLLWGLSCIGTSISNTSRVVDADTTNYASITSLLSVGCSQWISVKANSIFSAGTSAGFLIDDSGGLLDVTVIDLITITTYLNGSQRESKTSAGLVSLTLLEGSNKAIAGFKSSLSFDEVRITIASGVGLLGNLRVYNALYQLDEDQDDIADCVDTCPNNDCNGAAAVH